MDIEIRMHLSKHVSDPPETKAITDVKLTKLAFPHKSDPPMVDAKKVTFEVTRTLDLDMLFDEHHSDPPDKAAL